MMPREQHGKTCYRARTSTHRQSLIVAPFGTMEQEPGDAAGGRRGVVTLEALWAYGKR